MTPTQKQRELIEMKLYNSGWGKDRWGHFKKTVDGEDRRMKFQKTSVRYEVKVGKGWINLRSDYYKNVEVNKGGVFVKGGKCS